MPLHSQLAREDAPPRPIPRLPLAPLPIRNRICTCCARIVEDRHNRWNVGQDKCHLCSQDVAEENTHRRARLKIRIPNRAPLLGKNCRLCLEWNVLSHYEISGSENLHTRCKKCRTREHCTRCAKIKKRRRFEKRGRTGLWVSCDTCRDKAAQRAQNKWEAATAVDLRYCMVGRHRVEVAACTSEGQVYASCNECRAIRRDQYAAVTGAAAQADVGNGEDTLGNDDANGAAAAIKTFNEKLAELKIEHCPDCREEGFHIKLTHEDMATWTGQLRFCATAVRHAILHSEAKRPQDYNQYSHFPFRKVVAFENGLNLITPLIARIPTGKRKFESSGVLRESAECLEVPGKPVNLKIPLLYENNAEQKECEQGSQGKPQELAQHIETED
ncbi:hypothetical protein B0H14DRAFT_2599589 [Mycena olivaceomarginata]|nr:hypothetical protein B0H14DRAFT_2599589 [Mycena olivaceomarginata]